MMPEGTPESEEDVASPVLSYSMALREGKRIVAKLAELMSTPIADIEQPSLVDFSLWPSLSSTPGGAGDVPRRQLFQSPAEQNGGDPVCLLDTTKLEHSPSGPAASLTTAISNPHVGGHHNSRPDAVPDHPAIVEPAPSSELEGARHRGKSNKSISSGGIPFDDHELSLLQGRRDAAASTAPTSAATPPGQIRALCRDSMPLICVTPAVPKKPSCGFLARSNPEVVVPDRLKDEQSVVPSDRRLGFPMTETVVPVESNKAAASATALVPSDSSFHRSLSFIVAPAVDRVEADEATASTPAPCDTAQDRRLSFVVTPAADPVEADEAAATTSPDLPTPCIIGGSHPHSSETGEESFFTAYDSPLHPSQGSFIISTDESPLLGDSRAFPRTVEPGDTDLSCSPSGGALASGELPTAAVVAEAPFALPVPPTKTTARTRMKAPASAAASATLLVAPRKSKPIGITLATRQSLRLPPAASRRQERASAPVKVRVPLGRPGGAPKAAKATFMDPPALVAPPAGAPKVAPRLQPKELEPSLVRPNVLAPRGPASAPPAVAASTMSRQRVPAPGVASGAVRRTAAARRLLAGKTAVIPAPSVAARPPTRPPPPTTTSVDAGAKVSRPLVLAGLGRVSRARVFLPKAPLANKTPHMEQQGEPQAQKAQPPLSRIRAPRTRVACGFSRLPTMAGSSTGSRAALLSPLLELPLTHLSSTPVRGDLPPLDTAACPELTPIRRQ